MALVDGYLGACFSHSLFPRTGLRLVVLLLIVSIGKGYECGGFIGVTSSSSVSLQSPGYPGNYPSYTRCIWMLEAPIEHVVRLTVDFQGQTYNSQCSDYVVFRDGGESGDITKESCGTMTSETVTSSGRWMHVQFISDGISQAQGLSASCTAQHVGNSINNSITSPISSCRSFQFECRTKLCISRSYLCDGYYDCGCGHDCDEDDCGSLPINKPEQMAIGFTVGIALFLGAAAFGRLLEKHHNWEKETGLVSGQQGSRKQGWSPSSNGHETKASLSPRPSLRTSQRVEPLNVKVSDFS